MQIGFYTFLSWKSKQQLVRLKLLTTRRNCCKRCIGMKLRRARRRNDKGKHSKVGRGEFITHAQSKVAEIQHSGWSLWPPDLSTSLIWADKLLVLQDKLLFPLNECTSTDLFTIPGREQMRAAADASEERLSKECSHLALEQPLCTDPFCHTPPINASLVREKVPCAASYHHSKSPQLKDDGLPQHFDKLSLFYIQTETAVQLWGTFSKYSKENYWMDNLASVEPLEEVLMLHRDSHFI